MNWKNWKLGLFVAVITGFFTVLTVGVVIPAATLKELLFLFGASIGKDVLLFLKQNPPDKVQFDSAQISTAPDGTVTSQKSTLTVTQPQPTETKP